MTCIYFRIWATVMKMTKKIRYVTRFKYQPYTCHQLISSRKFNPSIDKNCMYIDFISLSPKLYMSLINIDRNVLNYAFILVRRN